MAQKYDDSLDLSFNIEGIGYTSNVKYDNAQSYWTDWSVDSKDSDQKSNRVRIEFLDDGATDTGWRRETYGESTNKDTGVIGVSVGLVGQSGVAHEYSIDFSTNWIDLPERTATINGSIHGTGEKPESRMSASINYYRAFNFDQAISGVVPDAGWEGKQCYLQNESLSIDYKTGDISYNKSYVNHELSYKDTWTVEHSLQDGQEDAIVVNGEIIGLKPNKQQRYTDVYSAFETTFATDSAVWNTKVAAIMGAGTPSRGYIKTRSISYNDVQGTIGYSYSWGIAPSSGEIDYSIDGAYSRDTDEWTFSCNGEVRGSGVSPQEKRNSALAMLPHEQEAWNHTYAVFVSKLHTNSVSGDVPRINALPNSRFLVSRNYGTDHPTGTVTFAYTWTATTGDYSNVSTNEYSWDEASATETISVNGIIKGNDESKLNNGWTAVYNGGDPVCPASIYALRHTSEFADTATTSDMTPNSTPIRSRPKSILSFNRRATLVSSSYSRKQTGDNNQLSYNFTFAYKAWPFGLPLWLKDVSITMNKKKSVDIWAMHNIIGKRSGPVHQSMNARDQTSFSFSISLNAGKRKADRFGPYLQTLLEDYAEFALRQSFLSYTGYAAFNYGYGTGQNCYITDDSFDTDIINGLLSRSCTITMLSIQD